jgi:hypothetical protein
MCTSNDSLSALQLHQQATTASLVRPAMSVLILCSATSLVADKDAGDTLISQTPREGLELELRSRHITPTWWSSPRRSEIAEELAKYACTIDCVLLVTPAPDPLHRVVDYLCNGRGDHHFLPLELSDRNSFNPRDVATNIHDKIEERLALKVRSNRLKHTYFGVC